jgi:hypothetical protein
MSELLPYTGAGSLTRDSRHAGRAINHSRAATHVRMSRINDENDVAIEKIEALTSTTGYAMSAVTRVAQLQRQLETLAPDASGRLALLADSHVLAVGDSLQDLRRSLRCK